MISKKVLMAILTFGMLAIVASAGTFAFFTASAQSTGNTIKAGTMALNLVSTAIDGTKFTITGAQPDNNVKIAKVLTINNNGDLAGKLSVTLANPTSPKGMYQYLTISVNDQVIYANGVAQTATLSTNMAAGANIPVTIKYVFAENGQDQSAVMGDTFTGDVVFTLNQI